MRSRLGRLDFLAPICQWTLRFHLFFCPEHGVLKLDEVNLSRWRLDAQKNLKYLVGIRDGFLLDSVRRSERDFSSPLPVLMGSAEDSMPYARHVGLLRWGIIDPQNRLKIWEYTHNERTDNHQRFKGRRSSFFLASARLRAAFHRVIFALTYIILSSFITFILFFGHIGTITHPDNNSSSL